MNHHDIIGQMMVEGGGGGGLEDYTTYTEVDSGGYLTVTANKVAALNLPRNTDSYVYKDYGAAFFGGDFLHQFEIIATALDTSPLVCLWAVQNSLGGYNAAADSIQLRSIALGISIREVVGGSGVNAAGGVALVKDVRYYCEVERDESVGTYGTVYVRVYTDSARTVLFGTNSLALRSKADFRYINAIGSFNSTSSERITLDIENLELVV